MRFKVELSGSGRDHESDRSFRGSCTILRGLVGYAVDFAESWLHLARPARRSQRCDEIYIKIGGRWMYLYRAVDQRGRTVEPRLSRTRDVSAATTFYNAKRVLIGIRFMGMLHKGQFSTYRSEARAQSLNAGATNPFLRYFREL